MTESITLLSSEFADDEDLMNLLQQLEEVEEIKSTIINQSTPTRTVSAPESQSQSSSSFQSYDSSSSVDIIFERPKQPARTTSDIITMKPTHSQNIHQQTQNNNNVNINNNNSSHNNQEITTNSTSKKRKLPHFLKPHAEQRQPTSDRQRYRRNNIYQPQIQQQPQHQILVNSNLSYLPAPTAVKFNGRIVYLISADEAETAAQQILNMLPQHLRYITQHSQIVTEFKGQKMPTPVKLETSAEVLNDLPALEPDSNSSSSISSSALPALPSVSLPSLTTSAALVLGFDIEWRTSFVRGEIPRKVALLQLATHTT